MRSPRTPFPQPESTMKKLALSSAALMLMFAGCNTLQSTATTTDIQLVLDTAPS